MLDQQILSPCSHRAVTGDHRPYQTAKSQFQGCLTYRNGSFSTQLVLNHASHGTFTSLPGGYLACISNTYWSAAVLAQNMVAQHHNLHLLDVSPDPTLRDQRVPSLCTLTVGHWLEWFGITSLVLFHNHSCCSLPSPVSPHLEARRDATALVVVSCT